MAQVAPAQLLGDLVAHLGALGVADPGLGLLVAGQDLAPDHGLALDGGKALGELLGRELRGGDARVVVHALAPPVQVLGDRVHRDRVDARLQVVEQELDAPDANRMKDRAQLLGTRLGLAAPEAVPRVRHEVAQLVALAARLVDRPQPLLEAQVLARERAAKRRLALERVSGRLRQLEQPVAVGLRHRDADARGDALDREHLELQPVGRRQAAAVEQHVLVDRRRRLQRRGTQRVEGGHAPAEIDRGGDARRRRAARRRRQRRRIGGLLIGHRRSFSAALLEAPLRRASPRPFASRPPRC